MEDFERLFKIFWRAAREKEEEEEEDAVVIANIALLFIFLRGRGVCATNACVIFYDVSLLFGFLIFSLYSYYKKKARICTCDG